MITKIIWNKKTATYTVTNGAIIVRNIPVRSQADCVKMELRNGFEPSFGNVEIYN